MAGSGPMNCVVNCVVDAAHNTSGGWRPFRKVVVIVVMVVVVMVMVAVFMIAV